MFRQNKAFLTSLTLIFILVVVLLLRGVFVSGYISNIPVGSAMSAYVEPALVNPGSTSLPLENSGFKILKTDYEDNSSWAIVTVSKAGNQATLIFKKINGVYSLVLGPGTTFPVSSTYVMPASVVSYLNSYGLVLNGTE